MQALARAALSVLSAVVLLAPVVLGARTLRMMHAFRREAFGHYRRAVTAFMASLGMGLAYYAVVVAFLLATARSGALVDSAGAALFLVHAQAVAAVAIVAAVHAGGEHLLRIIRPSPPLPPGAPGTKASPVR